MNKPILRGWLLALLLAAGSLGAQPSPRPVRVDKIEIRHLKPAVVSDDLVRANIRVREGDTYSLIATDSDVRALRATGYFRDIRVFLEPYGEGVKLIYEVQGRPLLTEIRFEGNTKYSRRKLLKKVQTKIGEPVDNYALFVAAQEMQKMYQKAGYHRTQVKPNVVVDEQSGRGFVTFEILEQPKVRIQDVEFVGAEAFSQGRLRRVIKTRRWWMFSWLTGSGKLKDDQFEEDQIKLVEFYQDEGYIDFDIKRTEQILVDPKHMVIRFEIFEGQQYKVGRVDFEGNTIFTDEQIRRGVPILGRWVRPKMLEGEIFTPKGLRDDLTAIEDFYGARGYIGEGGDSSIPVFAVKQPNVETGTMDLMYRVREGGQSRIEKIEISGNTKTRDKVIRRELAVSPGEVFNMVGVKASRERLMNMQLFTKVDTEVEPTDIADRKHLVIHVEEGQSGNFTVGAGFSSIESIFGYVRMAQGNFDLFNPPSFTGGGQKLLLTATLGTELANYELRFVEPWFLGRRIEFGLDLFHRDLRYYSDLYQQTETGGSVGLRKALWRQRLIGGVRYTLENIGLEFDEGLISTNLIVSTGPGRTREAVVRPPGISPELAAEEGDWLVSKASLSLGYDTRGGGLLPNRGQLSEIRGTLAGGPLGAEVDFYKLEFETSWYFRGLFTGHVLEAVGRIGVIEPYGDSDQTHLWDRFYLGGAYTLRGFKFREIGPKDSLVGEPIGGDTYWIGSVEYSLPIIERLRFALFYDIGVVNAEAYDFDPSNFHDNWGVGLRINIPQMGPIRLDYGFPIHYDDTVSGKPRFQFSVGWFRPI